MVNEAERTLERIRMEIVGSLTEAGIYMLAAPNDPTAHGEISRAIRRLAHERDTAREEKKNLQKELEGLRLSLEKLRQNKIILGDQKTDFKSFDLELEGLRKLHLVAQECDKDASGRSGGSVYMIHREQFLNLRTALDELRAMPGSERTKKQ